jgi:hypothetical protein
MIKTTAAIAAYFIKNEIIQTICSADSTQAF